MSNIERAVYMQLKRFSSGNYFKSNMTSISTLHKDIMKSGKIMYMFVSQE